MRTYGFAGLLLAATAAFLFSSSSALAACGGQHCGDSKHKGQPQRVEAKKPQLDVIDTAIAAGSFKTLATALEAGELVEALKGKGPFTVFAPTDEAFGKLPKGTLDALLKDKQKLRAILTYHVVPGKVTAADVVKLDSAKTLQGQSLKINTKKGVKVNNAKVVQADVSASNGVIHVIDTVLLPK